MERFLKLKDLFQIICRKCGSEDVRLSAEECEECGTIISAECNNCDEEFDYHDFKKIDEEDEE